MENSYYAAASPLSTGISIAYTTAPGGYFPLHWHEELEILYPLNGAADITIEGKKFRLLNKHMLVVESRKVHSTYTYDELSMFVCIHVSKSISASISRKLTPIRFSAPRRMFPTNSFLYTEAPVNCWKPLQDCIWKNRSLTAWRRKGLCSRSYHA